MKEAQNFCKWGKKNDVEETTREKTHSFWISSCNQLYAEVPFLLQWLLRTLALGSTFDICTESMQYIWAERTAVWSKFCFLLTEMPSAIILLLEATGWPRNPWWASDVFSALRLFFLSLFKWLRNKELFHRVKSRLFSSLPQVKINKEETEKCVTFLTGTIVLFSAILGQIIPSKSCFLWK